MHTIVVETDRGPFTVDHNGDFSGDVTVIGNGVDMKIPFEVFKTLVAVYVRDRTIDRLENADPDELLLRRIPQ